MGQKDNVGKALGDKTMTDAEIIEIMVDGVILHLGVPLSKDDPDRKYYRGTLGAAYVALKEAGLAIRPMEPTTAMKRAGGNILYIQGRGGELTSGRVYKAMMRAGK